MRRRKAPRRFRIIPRGFSSGFRRFIRTAAIAAAAFSLGIHCANTDILPDEDDLRIFVYSVSNRASALFGRVSFRERTPEGVRFESFRGTVADIPDGSHAVIRTKNGKSLTLRLLAADAPGMDSSEGVNAYLLLAENFQGKTADIRSDGSRARIFSSGRDAALSLIEAGHAKVKLSEADLLPSGDRILYFRAEKTAKEKRLGLWSEPPKTQTAAAASGEKEFPAEHRKKKKDFLGKLFSFASVSF